MKTYKLSFGEITTLQDDIAEVIINDGVEIDLEMVEEYHELLLNKMKPPFSLLVNKVNSYTYTFEAQQQIATLTQINAMAIVAYNKMTETSTKNLASMPRDTPWKIKIFNERKIALSWLQGEQR